MRKALLTGISVALFIALAAFGVSWYMQALQAKSALKQLIADINANEQYITYDAIRISGFPSNVFVSLEKPHFKGRVDTLLKHWQAQNQLPPDSGMANAISRLPEWTEDALLDGRVTVGVNAFSDKYSLHINGTWKNNSTIGPQHYATTTEAQSGSFCLLQMERIGGVFATLWNYRTLARDAEAFLRDLRVLDCNLAPYERKEDATGEKLYSSNGARFYITSAPNGAQKNIRLYIKGTDILATPQADKITAAYFTALAPDLTAPKPSLYGKQNIEMDATYQAPDNIQDAFNKNEPFAIALNKLELHNDLYDITANFHLNNEWDGPKIVTKLSNRFEFAVTELSTDLFQEGIRNAIHQLYENKDPNVSALKSDLEKFTPEQLYAVVKPALPDLHSLGRMVQATNISYKSMPNDHANGEVTLSALELTTTPYGINGNGSAVLNGGIPSANVTLNCNNCFAMVDDIFAYHGRVMHTLEQISPERAAAIAVSPDLNSGVKRFLSAVSTPGQNNALTFNLISDGKSSISLGGKRMDEVMILFADNIGRHLHASAPPAVTVPAQ